MTHGKKTWILNNLRNFHQTWAQFVVVGASRLQLPVSVRGQASSVLPFCSGQGRPAAGFNCSLPGALMRTGNWSGIRALSGHHSHPLSGPAGKLGSFRCRAADPLWSELGHRDLQHLHELGHYPHATLVDLSQDDGGKLWVVGLEADLHVPPGLSVGGLAAAVALDGVAPVGLWVGDITVLDEDDLALAGAALAAAEEAPGAVGDERLHGAAHHLGDEHVIGQLAVG